MEDRSDLIFHGIFFYSFIEIYYTQHKLISVIFSKFMKLCNHHYKLMLAHFQMCSKTKPPFLLLPILWQLLMDLLSVSWDLSVLAMSHQWKRTVCSFLCFWPFSLGIKFPRLFQVVVCIDTLFFVLSKNIPWLWTCHSLDFLHSLDLLHIWVVSLWALMK